MIETISYISTVLAVIGVVLNNYKLKTCFIIWLVSNSITAGIHLYSGLYGLAMRDVIFFGLAIHGLWKWSKK